jgi:Short C-terminal domain
VAVKCFCGCETKLRGNQIDLNLQASRLALELLAWDKARAAGRLGPPASDDAERQIERGAGCYQRLILTLHGEPSGYSLDEGEDWLHSSEVARRDRRYMTAKGGLFTANKLLLTEEDRESLDRVRPELSFTGKTESNRGGDVVSQLERLGALRAEGMLSDAEFSAAKARILGQG